MKIRKKVKMQNKSIRSRDLEDYLDDLEVRVERLLWTHDNVQKPPTNQIQWGEHITRQKLLI
jgi:hypothetical protein